MEEGSVGLCLPALAFLRTLVSTHSHRSRSNKGTTKEPQRGAKAETTGSTDAEGEGQKEWTGSRG